MQIYDWLLRMKNLEVEDIKNIKLEDYLRALWGAILKVKDTSPTWELFIQLFRDAYLIQPVDFDEAWLQIQQSADSIEIDKEIVIKDFEYLRGTILYQIADLRRMRDAGYFQRDASELYFGLESPTGARWYNWDSRSFVNRAIEGFYGSSNPYRELDDATWRELAYLLYIGQLYE